jgi:hypothetical protein
MDISHEMPKWLLTYLTTGTLAERINCTPIAIPE